MNLNLNFEVYELSSGKLVVEHKAVACYGNYVKHDIFRKNYRNHRVKLLLPVFQTTRVDGKLCLQENNLNTNLKADLKTVKAYLDYFNGRFAEYNVEVVTLPSISEASKLFTKDHGTQGFENLPGNKQDYKYIEVNIDLSQFTSEVYAKNVLFFLRNSNYSDNVMMMKFFKVYYEHIDDTNFNMFDVLQVGNFTSAFIQDKGDSEYRFFSRGYAGPTGDSQTKFLYYFPEHKYWEIFASRNKDQIDDLMKSRYTNYNTKSIRLNRHLTALAFLVDFIFKWSEKGYQLTDRDKTLLIGAIKKFKNRYK